MSAVEYDYNKIFREQSNDITSIIIKNYDLNNDYYKLIASQSVLGRKQLILNTKLLLYLMNKLIVVHKFYIDNIEFADNGIDQLYNLNQAIELVNKDSKYFDFLKDRLKIIIDEDSIEISKIQLFNEHTDIVIQSNGIIKCNIESSEKFNNTIKELLEVKLND